VKNIAAVARVKVSADGHGVVSHAGMGMVREVANLTGLSAQVIAALADTYRGPWVLGLLASIFRAALSGRMLPGQGGRWA